MKELFLVPKQCEEAYKNLANNIRSHLKKNPVDRIVYPAMGGYHLACQLGREFNIEWEPIEISFNRKKFSREFNKYKNKRILLVDDIYDTGRTFRYFIDNFRYKDLVMACLVTKQFYASHIRNSHTFVQYPLFSGDYVQPHLFVVFPWEKEFLDGLRKLDIYSYRVECETPEKGFVRQTIIYTD